MRKGNVDEYNFNWIKHLYRTNPGWTFKMIADETGWSKDVVSRACKSASFDEYKQLVDIVCTQKKGNSRRKYNTRMTEELFWKIKKEISKGMTSTAIQAKYHVCHTNVTAVRKSETFEQYTGEARKQNEGCNEIKPDNQGVSEWQKWYDGLITQMAKDASKARYELEQIHELMAFIADQLK